MITRLKQGDFFGELALVSAGIGRRASSVVAQTVCNLQGLSRNSLEEVFAHACTDAA